MAKRAQMHQLTINANIYHKKHGASDLRHPNVNVMLGNFLTITIINVKPY
jgi:hypothetical protein